MLVKNLGSDLGTIRERTQDTDTRLRTLKDEIDALRQTFLSLPALIAQSQSGLAPADPNNPLAPTNPPAGWRGARGATSSSAVVDAARHCGLVAQPRVRDGVRRLRRHRSTESAIAGFQQVVKNFPTAERADDAQFFIGESLGNLNRLPEAVDAYNLVIQKYPTGDQVDMAYLPSWLRGVARWAGHDAARATLEEVVKRFPNSQGAQLARQRLAGSARPPAGTPAKP